MKAYFIEIKMKVDNFVEYCVRCICNSCICFFVIIWNRDHSTNIELSGQLLWYLAVRSLAFFYNIDLEDRDVVVWFIHIYINNTRLTMA